MNTTDHQGRPIPPTQEIEARIESCRAEIEALKRLWRARHALDMADEAQLRRLSTTARPTPAQGGQHATD